MNNYFYRVVTLFIVTVAITFTHISAQTVTRPLVMPIAEQAGLGTWLFGQPYGNTTGAFVRGQEWYRAGQGLHFGIDISMPCGTQLIAVADGTVVGVDDLSFGSAPHNLLLRHEALGLTTLYGHLLERPNLVNGQPVTQGQAVALSGDPDLTCNSRPHLHLEIRSLDYRTAYNPISYIDANWNSLATTGSFGFPLFQQDLANPQRWMTLFDQPNVAFGGARLNNYAVTYPPAAQSRPPANSPLMRSHGTLPENMTWILSQRGFDCCFSPRWHPTDSNMYFGIFGASGIQAGLYVFSTDDPSYSQLVEAGVPPHTSPDRTLRITSDGINAIITRYVDGVTWLVNTSGALPSVSADNSRLLWDIESGVAGANGTPTSIWVSDISGANPREILADDGISARWLDASRLLISSSDDRVTTLAVYNTADDSMFTLGSWYLMRGLSVAPGGGRVMFYLPFQEDAVQNGVYVIDTIQGATAQHLSWFGSWRWRDADSVYYIPFDPTTDVQSLAYYHIPTGENRVLSSGAFTILNGEWDVSPDGRRILFVNALDANTWMLEYNEG